MSIQQVLLNPDNNIIQALFSEQRQELNVVVKSSNYISSILSCYSHKIKEYPLLLAGP